MLYNDYCSEHYNNLYATNFPTINEQVRDFA